MVEDIKRTIAESAAALIGFAKGPGPQAVQDAARVLIRALRTGNKVLVCGNGGSAAQAQHFAAELVVRFRQNRLALPCVALSADSSVITAGANDLGYEKVFARQVEALGEERDVLVAISSSGTSPNVNNAVETALKKGLKVIYLCGANRPDPDPDVLIQVASESTPRVQEVHTVILHLLARLVEQAFVP